MFHIISKTIKEIIKRNSDLNEKDLAYFNYGLQGILGTMLEILVLFIFAYLLNIFWPVLIAITSFLILRPHAGGIHLPTYFLCMSFSIVLFLILGLIANYVVISRAVLLIWLILVFLFSLYMIIRFAPADTKTIPIEDPTKRKTLKKNSIIIILIWIIASILINLISDKYYNLILASSLGILTEILGMHPIAFYLSEKYLPEHD